MIVGMRGDSSVRTFRELREVGDDQNYNFIFDILLSSSEAVFIYLCKYKTAPTIVDASPLFHNPLIVQSLARIIHLTRPLDNFPKPLLLMSTNLTNALFPQ
jgi:hypothetical protein